MPIFVSSNNGFLFNLRNKLAAKIGFSWKWNHRADNGKVVSSLIKNISALRVTITETTEPTTAKLCRH